MTDRQREVLTFVRHHLRRFEVPPTLAEIAQAIGVSHRSTAHSHVEALVRDGYLEARKVRGATAYYPTEKQLPRAA